MPEVYADEQLTVELVPALGSFGNNVYLLRPAGGGEVTVVDFPEGFEAVAAALGGQRIGQVLLTHSHVDHTRGYAALRAYSDAPIYAGADEADLDAGWGVRPLRDGEGLRVGGPTVRAIHTPGHTPGSTCYLVGGALFSGDTLFPGGPGHSRSPQLLQQELASIETRLLVLPESTRVLPGHGADTSIGESRREYAVFTAKEHPADLHGDVLWLEA